MESSEMKTPGENFSAYLKMSAAAAQREIDNATIEHQKRVEFWKGYKRAMEEVLSSSDKWAAKDAE